MREILFRGKRIDNGEWVEGYYVKINDVSVIITEHYVEYFDRISGKTSNSGQYIVDRSTVGQYTGLTDKNGKKIFEGDIVKHLSDNMVYLIEYDNRFGMYVSKRKNSSYSGCIRCEIISNIHDNPELLEVE